MDIIAGSLGKVAWIRLFWLFGVYKVVKAEVVCKETEIGEQKQHRMVAAGSSNKEASKVWYPPGLAVLREVSVHLLKSRDNVRPYLAWPVGHHFFVDFGLFPRIGRLPKGGRAVKDLALVNPGII